MKKGITFIEILIVLLIVGLTTALVIPTWQHYDEKKLLQREQQRLYTFIRMFQLRAENANEAWTLTLKQDSLHKTWCIIAQQHNAPLCDCFSPQSCSSQTAKLIYKPFHQQINLYAKVTWPKPFTTFNGAKHNWSNACAMLFSKQYAVLFSFHTNGILKLKPEGSKSGCNLELEDEDHS